MDCLKSLFAQHDVSDEREYAPLALSGDSSPLHGADADADADDDDDDDDFESGDVVPFSWLEYSIFVLLGIAMLWAWNMFLTAAPYFQTRLASSPTLTAIFQPLILAISTLTNLLVMLLLQNKQASASYPFRISLALVLSTATFALLTLSTVVLTTVPPAAYLVFILAATTCSACADGLIQNGAFAFAAGFARPEYMQALMFGQSVAGVLPPVSEVLSVMLLPGKDRPDGDDEAVGAATAADSAHMSSSAAFAYFFTAVVVSLVTLVAFGPLVQRHADLKESRAVESRMVSSMASIQSAQLPAAAAAAAAASRSVRTTSMSHLFSRLSWHASTLFICFSLTMFYPVLTTRILSVHRRAAPPSIFQPAAFIPLAFLFWNLGDLLGRLVTVVPAVAALGRSFPKMLVVAALARIVFMPLYGMCNLDGNGAAVQSDLFYLVFVQMGFGLTNGCISSNCIMAAGDHVDQSEREAAGGFMGLFLAMGLAAGSFLSFLAAALF